MNEIIIFPIERIFGTDFKTIALIVLIVLVIYLILKKRGGNTWHN
jgi:uncharacterized membrane protein